MIGTNFLFGQDVSNWCIRRYWKLGAEISIHLEDIEEKRDGALNSTPLPSQARVNFWCCLAALWSILIIILKVVPSYCHIETQALLVAMATYPTKWSHRNFQNFEALTLKTLNYFLGKLVCIPKFGKFWKTGIYVIYPYSYYPSTNFGANS